MRTFAWASASLVTHAVWVPFDSTCGGLGRGLLAPWRARQGEAVWWVRTTTIKPQSFEIPLSELLPIHSILQTVIKVGMYLQNEWEMHAFYREEGAQTRGLCPTVLKLCSHSKHFSCLLRLFAETSKTVHHHPVTRFQLKSCKMKKQTNKQTFLLHTDKKIKLRSVS